jgi:thioredoxin-related protein
MKIAVVTAALALVIIAWGLQGSVTPGGAIPPTDYQAFGDSAQDLTVGPDWVDFTEAVALGDSTGRPSMVFLYADWCGVCRRTLKETFTDSEVLRFLGENFQSVKLNVDSQKPVLVVEEEVVTEQDLAAVFGANVVPTFVFLTAEGKPVSMTQGFYPPELFLEVLQEILAG